VEKENDPFSIFLQPLVMRIRGILFDKDGTLIDLDATWLPAYRAAARHVEDRAGRPELADRLLAEGGLDPASGRLDPDSPLAWAASAEIARTWAARARGIDTDALAAEISAMFDRHAAANAVALADLGPLFAGLRARGCRLGVATMDSEASARAMLAACGALSEIEFIAGHDSGHGRKPDPGMVAAFCRAGDLEPREVAVVGDSPADMMMARAAGAGLAVGVLTGPTPADRLVPLADHVLASVVEIGTVLD
jgi:phosphoglycolate phosphatase